MAPPPPATPPQPVPPPESPALPGPSVSAEWLADRLVDHPGSVVVVDVRWYLDGRSGREAFEQGHLPGAVFADIDTDLSAPPAPPGTPGGRHPLPSPAAFATAMGRLGIGDGTAVVAYDDTGGMTAGRLWWMLDSLGESAAVLDGGIAAWDGPLESGPAVDRAPAHFRARPWPSDRFVDADTVAAAAQRPGAVVLDARAPERYRGEENAIDPRFGHVPGAHNLPWAANLGADGRMLPTPRLVAAQHDTVPALADADEVIAYCGSGVSACATLLGLRMAGAHEHAALRLYVGSWSEWGADPARPVSSGSP